MTLARQYSNKQAERIMVQSYAHSSCPLAIILFWRRSARGSSLGQENRQFKTSAPPKNRKSASSFSQYCTISGEYEWVQTKIQLRRFPIQRLCLYPVEEAWVGVERESGTVHSAFELALNVELRFDWFGEEASAGSSESRRIDEWPGFESSKLGLQRTCRVRARSNHAGIQKLHRSRHQVAAALGRSGTWGNRRRRSRTGYLTLFSF